MSALRAHAMRPYRLHGLPEASRAYRDAYTASIIEDQRGSMRSGDEIILFIT